MLLLLYIILFSSSNVSLEDDFLLVKNYDTNKYYCITNSSFAISWTGNTSTESSQTLTRFIRNPTHNGVYWRLNPYDGSHFRKPWNFETSLKSVNSNLNRLILDRRWENLKVYRTNNTFEYAVISETENFRVPFSIRVKKDTHIFLCPTVGSSCYWLALEIDNQSKSFFKKCVYKDNRLILVNQCDAIVEEILHPEDVPHFLSETKWSHFELAKSTNRVALFEKSRLILDFNSTEEIKATTMTLHTGKDSIGFWKIHKVDYLYTEKESQNIQIGPVINVINGSICISMFVIMCFLCQLKLTLADPSNSTLTLKEQIYRPQPGWFEIRFVNHGIKLKQVVLLISTINEEKFQKFWAVDEVRQCQEKEFRVLMSSTKSNCQLFSDTRNIISSEEKLMLKPSHCPENTFGKSCIPCSWIFSNSCERLKICEKTKKKAECSCSSGYTFLNSSECDYQCQSTRYGHSCLKFCARCSNKTCNHVDGTCSPCIDDYSGPKCDIEPNYFAIFGPYLSLLVILVLIVGLIICFVRYNKKRKLLKSQNVIFHNDKPVEISNFLNYVKISLENGQLKNQYEVFASNSSKVLYDEVVGNLRVDYIDMHYTDELVKKAYLVSEFPKLQDFTTFWELVWDENIENIVLIDNIDKKTKNYWPTQKKTLNFQNISIQLRSSEYFADYEDRKLVITRNGDKRGVNHLRFVSWGNNDDVAFPLSFVPFLKKMSEMPLSEKSPILIHSRQDLESVNFILLCNMCLRKAEQESVVDVLKTFQKLNDSTSKPFVFTFEAYVMVHLVILENLLFVDNNVRFDSFDQKYLDQNQVKQQICYLKETQWLDRIVDVVKVKEVENYFWVVQSMRQDQVLLAPSLSSGLEPITVDGFRSPSRFILTHRPTKNSLADFWRLVKEVDATVIVSLNKGFQFWPTETEPVMAPLKYLTIKHEISKNFGSYDWMSVQLHSDGKTRHKNVDIISLKNWQTKIACPPSVSDFVNFCTESNSLSVKSKKVIVTSFDCAKTSGLYVTMLYNIEKIKMEGAFDVCTAVRSVRRHGFGFRENEEQVKFLWEAASYYLKTFVLKNR